MYSLLIRLMFLTALFHFGISLTEVATCQSKECVGRIGKASREVLRIDWKPISVWPEEARRFR